jgi:hypothetical protein
MRRDIRIFFTAVALILTWPLHIAIASYYLTEWIGDLFAPKQDHVLLWFPIAGIGVFLLVILAVGVAFRNRLALSVAALVFLGGFAMCAGFPRQHGKIE